MKTIATIFIAVLLFTVNGFSQSSNVKALLDNQETKTEVFNAILNDHQLMSEFMTAMKGNKHATMMMQNSKSEMHGMQEKSGMKASSSGHKMEHGDMMGNNPEMMKNNKSEMHEMHGMKASSSGHKMEHGDMMGMMKNNPEMMKNMMEMCMKDSAMRCTMVEMMTEQPEMMKSIKMKMVETEKTGLDKMH